MGRTRSLLTVCDVLFFLLAAAAPMAAAGLAVALTIARLPDAAAALCAAEAA
jgi:hypothetical protein